MSFKAKGRGPVTMTHRQGRRHGVESEGDNFAGGASKKIFLTPHVLASGGGQNIA